MACGVAGISIFIILNCPLVICRLVRVPFNQISLQGETIHVNCATDKEYSVKLQHVPIGSHLIKDVYISRVIVGSYSSSQRFTVSTNEIGNNVTEYDLAISAVQNEDAGRYICHDEAGQGQREEAQLTVLHTPPKCHSNIEANGFIGENDCGVQQENIHCNCTVGYTGNIVPEMEWVTSDGNIIQSVAEPFVSHNSVSSGLHVTATIDLSGAAIVWRATNSTHNNWTSNEIKIMYVKENLTTVFNEIGNCSANSSEHCTYRWIARNHQNYTSTIFEGAILEVNDTGSYRCEASCPLQGTSCRVTSLHIEHKGKGCDYGSSLFIGVFASIAFFGGLLVAIIIIIIIIVRGIHSQYLINTDVIKRDSLLGTRHDVECTPGYSMTME